MQLVRELLARPLPDIPITIPGRWGIPAPFAPTAGQVVYPWVEAMPASMYSTWHAAGGLEAPITKVDGYWRAERNAEVVYFHGFDNTYHWGLMDLTMLVRTGGCERTRGEYEAFVTAAGLKLQRLIPTAGPISLIEAVAR